MTMTATTTPDIPAIESVIIEDILLDGLDMAGLGYDKDQIGGATPLFEEEGGLGLDSLAALEVAILVQQKFGFKVETLNREFFEANCTTVNALAQYIQGRLS